MLQQNLKALKDKECNSKQYQIHIQMVNSKECNRCEEIPRLAMLLWNIHQGFL